MGLPSPSNNGYHMNADVPSQPPPAYHEISHAIQCQPPTVFLNRNQAQPPPPAPTTLDYPEHQPNGGARQFRVARKPLRSFKSSPELNVSAKRESQSQSSRDQTSWDTQAERLINDTAEYVPPLPQRPQLPKYETTNNPPLPPRPILSLQTSVPLRMLGPKQQMHSTSSKTSITSTTSSPGELFVMSTPNSTPSTAASSVHDFGDATPGSSSSLSKPPSSFVQNAFQEARHFAGSLIHHPSESTKHFSILRHSHGLVFYQGPSTSLAISIFATEPMPGHRTLWLQEKGWSGKTGMRAKAYFGSNGGWIDVTPSMSVGAEQLNPRDERAWQRDITSFKRRSSAKIRERHQLRETFVIRVPSEAGDGYFQLVLCIGDKKKVLCHSPTFRILSVSASPSSMRGASIATLPMEIGIKAAEIYAKKTAGLALAPAKLLVESRVAKVTKHVPGWWLEKGAHAVEGASGAKDKENKGSFVLVGGEDISLEDGPAQPYPLYLSARTQNGYKLDPEQRFAPVLTLAETIEVVSQKLYGYYFGWCRFKPNRKLVPPIDENWHITLINALPPTSSQLIRANFSQANTKVLTIQIIDELGTSLPEFTNVEIFIMGFLRPDNHEQRVALNKGHAINSEEAAFVEINDMCMTQAILDKPAWSPEVAQNIRTGEKIHGLKIVVGGISGAKTVAMGHLDKVPLHRFGLRTDSELINNNGMVVNGFFVRR